MRWIYGLGAVIVVLKFALIFWTRNEPETRTNEEIDADEQTFSM